MGLPESGLDAQALRAVSMTDLITTYYALEKDHLAPLTTADGIVIPEEGIAAALGSERSAKRVPVLAGSNRDEVSLWLGLNRYFVEGNDVSLGFAATEDDDPGLRCVQLLGINTLTRLESTGN